jgi:glycosyltransferase involved in cell wall biosynthesis
MNLYLTADKVGVETGGGKVTDKESQALKSLGECEVWGRDQLVGGSDPWGWDKIACGYLDQYQEGKHDEELIHDFKLCHLYSGSMTETVKRLKGSRTKVCYTIAAHRISDSKKAHEELGIPYSYSHLTDREQWKKYSGGYWNSDVIVVPSNHSKIVVEEQMDDLGIENHSKPEVRVIPHGCDLPDKIHPIPKQFTVGYLGNMAADKGTKYLLEAWKKLNYKDALLIIGGKDSESPVGSYYVNAFGGGSIWLMGWVPKLSDFYKRISLYVQPSTTEGFGIEVLEAMAHGRPVLCSDHAGAKDVVPYGDAIFEASNVDSLAETIEYARSCWDLQDLGKGCAEEAQQYTWEEIQQRYISLWKSLL